MLRTCQLLTILTWTSLSRAGVVQIFCEAQLQKALRACQLLTIFDFQITLARRRGANFAKLNFKAPRACHFLTILTSKSLSRAGAVQILLTSWAADPPQLPFFGADFASPRSHETMEKQSISRNSYPPKSLMSRICAVKHLCCQTSMLQDLAATFSIVGS